MHAQYPAIPQDCRNPAKYPVFGPDTRLHTDRPVRQNVCSLAVLAGIKDLITFRGLFHAFIAFRVKLQINGLTSNLESELFIYGNEFRELWVVIYSPSLPLVLNQVTGLSHVNTLVTENRSVHQSTLLTYLNT